MPTEVQLIKNNAVTGAGINNLTITGEDIAPGTISSDKTNFSTALFPVGGIIMWSGTTTPVGWQLCNGSQLPSSSPLRPGFTNTPNLQDRFIVGAGSGYAVGNAGGNADATLVAHNHGGSTGAVGNHTHGGSTGAVGDHAHGGVTQRATNRTLGGQTTDGVVRYVTLNDVHT